MTPQQLIDEWRGCAAVATDAAAARIYRHCATLLEEMLAPLPRGPSRLIPLRSAGYRERDWTRTLFSRGEFPRKWTLEDVLARAKYDPSRDQIAIDINGTPVCWRVERP